MLPEKEHTLQESSGSESYRFGTGNHRGQGKKHRIFGAWD